MMRGTPTLGTDAPAANDTRSPILLFGMPRSGTTWLGKIFDSHPDTLYRHEPDSFGRLNFMPLAPEPGTAAELAARLQAFVDALPDVRDTKISATLPDFPKSYLSGIQFGWNRVAIRAAKLQARRAGGEARAPLWLPGGDRARVVWKSIESTARLGTIAAALPRARGVLIVRHPCGYVASVLRGHRQAHFTDPDDPGTDFGVLEALQETETARAHGIDRSNLKQLSPLARVAWQWALVNDKALTEAADGDQFLPLRYEDLCAAPVTTARNLFDWCGLDWHPQTERFLDASTHRHQDRYYSVYKDPTKAANAWREELPDAVQSEVMDAIGHTRAGRLFGSDRRNIF